jgi:hypothetical protein
MECKVLTRFGEVSLAQLTQTFAACADPRSYAQFQAPSPPLDRRMSVPIGKTSIALKGLLPQIAIHDPSTKRSSGEATPLETSAIALFW